MSNVHTLAANPVAPVFPIVRNDAGQLVHQTPEALHPGQIKGDSAPAKYARDVMSAASEQLARFNAMWVRRDDNLHRLASNVKLGEFDNAKADFKAEAQELEASLITKANLKPKPEYITAICGAYFSMTPEQRAKAMADAIAAGDGPTLAVLDEAPLVATGITSAMQASIRPQLFAKADPQTFVRLNEAKANYAKIDAAMNANITALAKLAQKPDVVANDKPEEARSVALGFKA